MSGLAADRSLMRAGASQRCFRQPEVLWRQPATSWAARACPHRPSKTWLAAPLMLSSTAATAPSVALARTPAALAPPL